MGFPCSPDLVITDEVNDEIWQHLHLKNRNALDTFNHDKYCIKKIKEEITTGCSPCPDILTKDFGKKTSVLFISTVYGLIYKYLFKKFNRETDPWYEFIQYFYDKIIQRRIGIYHRLSKIYDLCSLGDLKPEFCFTELVKTVLVNSKNEVSGVETGEDFIKYYLRYESPFLSKRLAMINSKCIAFTFSETTTFFTLTTLADLKKTNDIFKLPSNIELFYSEFPSENLKFICREKRTGNLDINVYADDTYSKSIAFRTIFKVKNKEFYIIPLPHPSRSNNGNWSEDVWKELKKLIEKIT